MGLFDELVDNQGSTTQSTPTVTPKTTPYARTERGFLGDTASSLGRGVLGLVGLGSKAYETITGAESPLDEWAENTRDNVEFFKPDRSAYFDRDGFISRGWKGAMESLAPSVAGFAPGAAAGATVGGLFGGVGAVPGAAIGGVLSTLGLFGAGTYGEAKDAALIQGMDADTAHDYAMKQAFVEGGIEGLASGAEVFTAGIGKFFTRPLASTLKGMLKLSAKDLGKEVGRAYLKTAAVEGSTEMLQSGLGTAIDQEYGMAGDATIGEAMAESIMPSIFMSGIFTLGGQHYSAKQRARLKNMIESKDSTLQTVAFKALTDNIEKTDPELADGVRKFVKPRLGKSIDINLNLVEMMEEVQANEKAKAIDPMTTDMDTLTGQVNAKLWMDVKGPVAPIETTGTEDSIVEGFFKDIDRRYGKLSEGTREDVTEPTAKAFAAKVVEDRKKKQDMERKAALPKGVTPEMNEETQNAYAILEAEENNIRKQLEEAKSVDQEISMTLDALEEGGQIVPQERALIEDAYKRRNDEVELTEEQQKLVERIGSGWNWNDHQEGTYTASGTYIAAESVGEDVSGETLIEGQNEASIDSYSETGETAYDKEGNAVNTTVDPADVITAREESLKSDPNATLIRTEDGKEILTEPLTPETELILTKDPAAFKAKVRELLKAEGHTRKAEVSNRLLDQAENELKSRGEEWQLTEDERKTLHQEATYAGSSRRGASNKLDWKTLDEQDTTVRTATDETGRSYILDTKAETIMYKDADSGQWYTVKVERPMVKTNKGVRKADKIQTMMTAADQIFEGELIGEPAGEAQLLGDQRRNLKKLSEDTSDYTAEETTDVEEMTLEQLITTQEGREDVDDVGVLDEDTDYNTGKTDMEVSADSFEAVEDTDTPDSGVKTKKRKLSPEVKAKMKALRELEAMEGERLEDLVLPEGVEFSNIVRYAMDEGTRETNALEVLNEMKEDRKSFPKEHQALIGLLLKVVPKEKLQTILIKPMSKAPANQQQNNSFWLTKDRTAYYGNGATGKTLLHEIVHGISATEVRQLGKNHPLIQRLDAVFDSYQSFLGDSKRTARQDYALKNKYELLSMALTEQEVQADLKVIPLPRNEATSNIKTMWDKLIDTVRNVFGLPKEYHSALEELLTLTTEISQTPLLQKAKVQAVQDPLLAELLAQGIPEAEARETAKVLRGTAGFKLSAPAEATMDDTIQYIRKVEDQRIKEKEPIIDWVKKAMKKIDEYIQPISDEIAKISPKMLSRLKSMESNLNTRNTDHHNLIRGFAEKYKNLPKEDKVVMKYYLLNSNNAKEGKELQTLLKRHKMTAEFADVQKVLDDIYNGYRKVGLNLFNRIDRYFPRKVKDVKGLLAYIRTLDAKKRGEMAEGGQGILDEILESKMSDVQKAQEVAAVINSGYNPATALKIPTSAKSRRITKVAAKMMEFYHDPVDALVDTIFEGNEAIVTREFVGSDNRRRLTKEINRLHKKLLTLDKGSKEYTKLSDQIQGKLAEIRDITEVSTESIGDLVVSEGIKSEDQDRLVAALRARLNQKGMHGGVASLRDIGLISALGSPLNAITQLGDLVWSFYENGGINTVKAIFGPKEITTKDLDMSHVLKEFAQGNTAKWVEKTLKWTGFSFMDQFGKNVNLQAALNKARSMEKEQFVSKWSEMLTPETAAQTWEDIKAGNMSDKVKHFAFTSVSKFQPVSLSEMPQQYLTAGNGRIFYTLKSYGIKALANIRREVITEYQKGNTTQASKNLVSLLSLLVLGNATVDELKDFILGREEAFSDKVWDNLLKLGFASRYTIDRGFSSGKPVYTFVKDVLMPPGVGAADPFLKDIYNMVSSEKDATYSALKAVPVLGKIAYSRTGEGQTKEMDNRRRDIYSEIRASVSDGSSYSSVRKKINAFNREARKVEGVKKIDNKTIRSIKAKERKKLREQ